MMKSRARALWCAGLAAALVFADSSLRAKNITHPAVDLANQFQHIAYAAHPNFDGWMQTVARSGLNLSDSSVRRELCKAIKAEVDRVMIVDTANFGNEFQTAAVLNFALNGPFPDVLVSNSAYRELVRERLELFEGHLPGSIAEMLRAKSRLWAEMLGNAADGGTTPLAIEIIPDVGETAHEIRGKLQVIADNAQRPIVGRTPLGQLHLVLPNSDPSSEMNPSQKNAYYRWSQNVEQDLNTRQKVALEALRTLPTSRSASDLEVDLARAAARRLERDSEHISRDDVLAEALITLTHPREISEFVHLTFTQWGWNAQYYKKLYADNGFSRVSAALAHFWKDAIRSEDRMQRRAAQTPARPTFFLDKLIAPALRSDWLFRLSSVSTILISAEMFLESRSAGDIFSKEKILEKVYLALLTAYAADKELGRLFPNQPEDQIKKRKGQLFVAWWVAYAFVLVFLSEITHNAWAIPHNLQAVVTGVMGVFLGRELLKKFLPSKTQGKD